MKSFPLMDLLKFIIPSILGVFLFIIPVKTDDGFSIPVALLANHIQGLLEEQLSFIMMIIIVLTAIFTVIAKLFPNFFNRTPFFQNLFSVHLFWTITRVLAAIFAVMVFYKLGPDAIQGPDTGQLLLDDLLHVLFSVFLFAGLFLPLLTDFGLLEFFGTMMKKIMRPLFTLPGRSSVDALASWIGDGTIGVLLTSKQYEEGFYTKREAAVIGTTFSVVSITFSLVVLAQVDLAHMFLPFYITILIAGIACALIMPRIPPLSRKEDTYINSKEENKEGQLPDGETALSYGIKQAVKRAQSQKSIYHFFKEGGQNILDMLMGVAPIVMTFGLVALIIAEFTPIFQWLGTPFIPILELLQIPYAKEASETILIGFADMFLPSVIGAGIEAEITRFVIAALSVSQLIYMSEVGGLLLGSKIPVSFWDLIFIFLLRTIISLPIIALCAHIIF